MVRCGVTYMEWLSRVWVSSHKFESQLSHSETVAVSKLLSISGQQFLICEER